MVAQFIFTHGLPFLELFWWIRSNTFSFPAPVSPCIITLQSYLATFSAISTTSAITGLANTKSSMRLAAPALFWFIPACLIIFLAGFDDMRPLRALKFFSDFLVTSVAKGHASLEYPSRARLAISFPRQSAAIRL